MINSENAGSLRHVRKQIMASHGVLLRCLVSRQPLRYVIGMVVRLEFPRIL